MNYRLVIVHDADLYEVRLREHVIVSIIRYLNGSNLRQEVEYDLLPLAIRDKILDKVSEILSEQ